MGAFISSRIHGPSEGGRRLFCLHPVGGLAKIAAMLSIGLSLRQKLPPLLLVITAISSSAQAEGRNLSMGELRTLVLAQNWSIQGKLLDFESKRRQEQSSKGVFDPTLSLAYQYEDSQRPNTVEQRRQLEGVPELSERNHTYSASLQTLTPLGTKMGLTFTASDLRNNLQQLKDPILRATGERERVSFLGVTLTQPLLRDAGKKAALAAIRLAATESEQAYQDFRRQLMVTLSSAELAYWNLYMAQEQMAFFEQSLGLTTQMQKDAETEVKAEKSPPLKLATASAASAQRRGHLMQARQQLIEAQTALAGFCGLDLASTGPLRATDSPPRAVGSPTLSESLQKALESNPDFLVKQAELQAEHVRVEYAKNQNRPRLDLKAAYGLNGLGSSYGDSFDDLSGWNYPAWSLGLEFSVPLGNREASNRLAATLVRLRKAESGVTDARLQLVNGVDGALRKVQLARQSLDVFGTAVKTNQEIVDSHLVDLKAGKIELRLVLEAEEDLSQSRINSLMALVTLRQALLEFDLATGQTLATRNLEISREELTKKTAALVRGKFVSDDAFAAFMKDFRDSLAQGTTK